MRMLERKLQEEVSCSTHLPSEPPPSQVPSPVPSLAAAVPLVPMIALLEQLPEEDEDDEDPAPPAPLLPVDPCCKYEIKRYRLQNTHPALTKRRHRPTLTHSQSPTHSALDHLQYERTWPLHS